MRERGYLSHGIERWFALDPWRSRAFWLELLTVAVKAGLLVALFAILPLVAVMLFRNHPLTAFETLALALFYGVTAFAVSTTLLVSIALILRLRPQLAVDTPRALLGISFAASALLTAPIAVWWARFGAPPSWPELLTGLALTVLFFLMVTVAVSAALLSFSIYELRRVPALHAHSRAVPMSAAAAILIAILFLPTYFVQENRTAAEPLQVVTRPSTWHVAVIAVDGLTLDLLRTRPMLLQHHFFPLIAIPPVAGESATERWASVGTGVPPRLHGVRAIEGVRVRGGRHLLQSVSNADVVLRRVAEAAGLTRREPLPPSQRRRDYVWEVFGARGVPAYAVNWWTSDNVPTGTLESVSQETVFAVAARGNDHSPAETALRVDAAASRMLLQAIHRFRPQVATAYLPALDIVLNRLPLDAASRVALSVRALNNLESLVDDLHRGGYYDVIVIGLPGERQPGGGVMAFSFVAEPGTHPSAYDLAPTLCTLEGFPATSEMPGRSIAWRVVPLPRIPTFGRRAARGEATKVNEEYYQNLKSLGYIR